MGETRRNQEFDSTPLCSSPIEFDSRVLDSEHIFNQVVFKVYSRLTLLGFVAFCASICRVFQTGWHPLYTLQFIGIVLLFLLYFLRRQLLQRLVAMIVVILMFLYAYLALFSHGLGAVGGILAMLSACVLTAAIYGQRTGFLALILTMALYSGVGYASVVLKWIPLTAYTVEDYFSKGVVWVHVGVDFLVLGYVLIFAISLIQQQLRETIDMIRKQSRFTHTALDSLDDMLFAFSPSDGKLIQWNRAFSNAVGLADREIEGRRFPIDWKQTIRCDEFERIDAPWMDERVRTFEATVCSNAQEDIPYEFRVSQTALRSIGGTLFLCVGRDLRERFQAQRELEEQVFRYRLITENVSLAVWTADKGGELTYLSQSIEEFTGYTAEEVVSSGRWSVLSRIHEDDRQIVQKEYEKLFRQKATINVRYREAHKCGKWIWIHFRGAYVEENGVPYAYCGIISDITDQVRAEEAMYQEQKLNTLGRLAGGIAHDFNNQIMAILGCVHSLKDAPLSEADVYECAEHIRMCADHASTLTDQLVSYSRKRAAALIPLDVHSHVNGLYLLLKRSLPKAVRVRLELCTERPVVRADPTGLHNALMNLCLNGKEAMPNGGELTISTHIRQHRTLADAPFVEGETVVILSVSDTGRGMDTETKKLIFEPFFTTKPEGEGTGMGLATVYSFIKNIKGDLSVTSSVGNGTCISLYFPLHKDPSESIEF